MTQFLHDYVERHLSTLVDGVTPDTPLFWSSWANGAAQLKRAVEVYEGKALDILSS